MRKGAGKSKGSSFERDIARRLSMWLTGGVDDRQLIRTVLSGGWTRGQESREEGWRHVGDLAPNGPIGEQFRRRFAVECKHRKTIDLYGCWSRQDAIAEWWPQLRKDCAGIDFQLQPLLVFRPNSRPIMVGMVPEVAAWLRIHNTAIFSALHIAIFPFELLLACSPTRVLTGTVP